MGTVSHPTHQTSKPRARIGRHGPAELAAAAAIAATVALAVSGPDEASTPSPSPAAAMPSAPSSLTAAESADARAALRRSDERTRSVARQVLSGTAGFSALGDPATLHHHGVNTASGATGEAAAAAERFHHR
jgi:hypothetical protein